MALISEVTEKEAGIHPGHFAKSNLACVDELTEAITQVNIDQLTLKMSDMHHALSLQDSRQISTVYRQIFAFSFYFLHPLNIRCIICWLCPNLFQSKTQSENMLIRFNISYLAVYPVTG